MVYESEDGIEIKIFYHTLINCHYIVAWIILVVKITSSRSHYHRFTLIQQYGFHPHCLEGWSSIYWTWSGISTIFGIFILFFGILFYFYIYCVPAVFLNRAQVCSYLWGLNANVSVLVLTELFTQNWIWPFVFYLHLCLGVHTAIKTNLLCLMHTNSCRISLLVQAMN